MATQAAVNQERNPDMQATVQPTISRNHVVPAAYDFRSDYVTIPTVAMLQSIASTTLNDDVGMEDPTTNDFQAFIAQLTGHEDALFVLSGTMGNQIALRAALTTPPYSVVADQRSHIARMEVGGPATLCGAQLREIMASNGHHLTLEDVQTRTSNTLGGVIFPVDEAARISHWARSQDPPIPMHLDGARLWEAVAADAGSLQEYCRLFDSVQLCLTKGLGAPIGPVIVGNRALVQRARWVRDNMLEGRIVVHYQICDDAVHRLYRVMAASFIASEAL
ncbi:threonine aldolase [Diplogelasinospora grovesii]|uniref:Threonine aldolase n=1 Tax=Diplogelasinospora grovesii TaxID=303347 RepID=A0AAN6NC88_9PEZI|nr:threonine aldolase [Diplogelasinospora grovesii]